VFIYNNYHDGGNRHRGIFNINNRRVCEQKGECLHCSPTQVKFADGALKGKCFSECKHPDQSNAWLMSFCPIFKAKIERVPN